MNLNDQQLAILKRRKYLEYLKLLPSIREERTKAYVSLILTFVAIAIFGLFAINPTLSTISQLHKQLDDFTNIKEELIQKSASLSRLEVAYSSLQSDFSLLTAFIPQTPNAPFLLGQIQSLAQKNGVTVTNLQSLQVDLGKQHREGVESSYVLTIDVDGGYEQLLQFVTDLTTFNRLLTFERLSLTNGLTTTGAKTVKLNIRARAYFKP